MKRFKIGMLICILALSFCMPVLAMDYTAPLRNAATVVAQGPDATGSQYGLMKVITKDGNCYLYLTNKGQYIKFKPCKDENWTDLYPKIKRSSEASE